MAEEPKTRSTGESVSSVYMTFPDEATAATVLGRLLEAGLIACANILPGARSLYRWEGAVQDEPEAVAFAKTSTARVGEVISRVAELHPYDTPCVVALGVTDGSPSYLRWVLEEAGG